MSELPRAVLFDWNGTFNDMSVLRQQDKHVGKVEFGLDLTDDDITACWGLPPERFYPALFGHPGNTRTWQEMSAIFQGYNAQFPRRLLPDAVSVLSAIKRAGLVTGLVTTSSRQMVETGMRDGGLPRNLLDILHTGEDLTPGQPTLASAIGEVGLRGILPSQTVYVGDETVTMSDAEAVGTGYVVVASGTMSRERLLREGVPRDHLIDTLRELPGLLGLPEESA